MLYAIVSNVIYFVVLFYECVFSLVYARYGGDRSIHFWIFSVVQNIYIFIIYASECVCVCV